jgi:hypothetical protein
MAYGSSLISAVYFIDFHIAAIGVDFAIALIIKLAWILCGPVRQLHLLQICKRWYMNKIQEKQCESKLSFSSDCLSLELLH